MDAGHPHHLGSGGGVGDEVGVRRVTGQREVVRRLYIRLYVLFFSAEVFTCRSCVAVALCSGFLTKHFLTKSVKSSDHSSGFLNVGGGLVGIMKIACKIAARGGKKKNS